MYNILCYRNCILCEQHATSKRLLGQHVYKALRELFLIVQKNEECSFCRPKHSEFRGFWGAAQGSLVPSIREGLLTNTFSIAAEQDLALAQIASGHWGYGMRFELLR